MSARLALLSSVLAMGCALRATPGPPTGPAFVAGGKDAVRLPAPLAEERTASAVERAFLSRLSADFGVAPVPAEDRTIAPVFWNELTTELGLRAGLPPPSLARAYALTQVAVFDALLVGAEGRRGALGEDALAAGAACKVLLHLFPGDSVRIRDAAASRLDDLARDGVRRGFLLGRSVGELVVRRARADSRRAGRAVPHGLGEGSWSGVAPVLPGAGRWRTWITTSGAEFQPAPPYPPGSAEDLRDLEDVYRASLARTPAQMAAARRWAEWPPPTLWNDELNRRLTARGWPLVRSARASAYLNAAMSDAFVSCWASKYRYWTRRPYMRLRGRMPMFTTVVTTPNFPSYTSGHSTVSAAAAAVLAELFADEAPAFRERAREAALSRFWGGIHFPHDNDEGLAVGARIGEKAVQRMRQYPAP